jgi:acetyltransferase-like isoleucine patch superfamily enzyme
LRERLIVGLNGYVDDGAILGYPPPRTIPDLTLRIGAGAHIRVGTILYAGSTIGDGLKTGHHVVIREENTIGRDLSIGHHSTIDYGCVLGDGVKIDSHVYLAQFTRVEDGAFLASGVTVASDPHPLCGKCKRGPTIRRGARVGVNVTLLPHVTIGEGALVGAGSVVTHNIPPFVVAYGNPARPIQAVDDLECPLGMVHRPYVNGQDVKARSDLGRRS